MRFFAVKDRWKFLLGFGVVAFLCSRPHAGFMMLLFAPLALVVQTYKLTTHWRNPAQKNQHLGAIIFVVLATLLVVSAHLYHHTTARKTADELAHKVVSFHALHGRFPIHIGEMGVPEFPKKLSQRPHYTYTDGKPMLFYRATFVVFEAWIFDFASQTWVYRPD